MDPEFQSLIAPRDLRPGEKRATETTLRVKTDDSGEIEVDTPDGVRPYMLKPLAELYGAGTGAGSVDPKDPRFEPLMMAIEGEVSRVDAERPGLTDGAVMLALGPLAMSPESAQADPLAQRVQLALRLSLSISSYSRQEVRQALRHVVRSVERHTKLAGRRGYLEFIRNYFPKSG
jgi:hypothetical protein